MVSVARPMKVKNNKLAVISDKININMIFMLFNDTVVYCYEIYQKKIDWVQTQEIKMVRARLR